MAAATDTTLGTVIGEGGDLLFSDATSPELVPTGVTPGDYVACGVYADVKGRVLYAKSLTEVDIPCATVFSCGLVIPGTNITAVYGADTEISIPLATTSNKGVVKVGSGFEIDGCVLRVDYDIATTTTLGLVIVPELGNIDVDGSGNISIPDATESSKGLVQVGSGLDVTAGVVSVDVSELSIPDATESSKGLMQVGSGLDASSGVVSVDVSELSLPDATALSKGVVQVGTNIDVSSGVISVPTGSTTEIGIVKGDEVDVEVDGSSIISTSTIASAGTLGLVKVGSGLGIDDGVLARGQGDATYSSKGIVQIQTGTGLEITAGDLEAIDATAGSKGVVQVGDNIDVSSGTISVPTAVSDTTFGVIQTADSNHINITSGELTCPNVTEDDQQNAFVGAQVPTLVTETFTSSWTPDFSASNAFKMVLTGNTTINKPTNLVAGSMVTFILVQDGTGSRTASFNSAFKFDDTPTLSTGEDSVDIVNILVTDTDTLVCQLLKDFS